MGFLKNIFSLFQGLGEFFGFFRDFFSALPLVVQVLIYFGFGGLMLLFLVQMVRRQ